MKLQTNDVVTFERKQIQNGRTVIRRHKVRITSVEERDGKAGQYCSYRPVDQADDNKGWYGFGCGWFGRDEPYGIHIVAHHGNQPTRRYTKLPNLYKNPSYEVPF